MPVIATGCAGGRTGADIRADLDARGVAHRFVDGARGRAPYGHGRLGGARRRHASSTSPARRCRRRVWASLLAGLAELVREQRAGVVVLSGSLPRGLPADAYSQLVASRPRARRPGRRRRRRRGAARRGHGRAGRRQAQPRTSCCRPPAAPTSPPAVTALRALGRPRRGRLGRRRRGPAGLPLGRAPVRARLREPLSGNPTGAGDALVAALAVGLEAADDWPTTAARRAVAWSAAAVRQPVAGEIDPDDVDAPARPRCRWRRRDDAGTGLTTCCRRPPPRGGASAPST